MTNRRVALTGGIACGKSLVAKFLNELGVETIDADDIVHELIPAEERRRLAKVVFHDEKARRELEARIHPVVKGRIVAFLDQSPLSSVGSRLSPVRRTTADRRQPTTEGELRLAVIPLLFETHWDAEYDIICCVRSSRATQVARMMTTRGYTREEAEARLKAQMPVEVKAAKSHYVIDNDGSAEELRAKVAAFVDWLKARRQHG